MQITEIKRSTLTESERRNKFLYINYTLIIKFQYPSKKRGYCLTSQPLEVWIFVKQKSGKILQTVMRCCCACFFLWGVCLAKRRRYRLNFGLQ